MLAVLVAQLVGEIPALQTLAPTQTKPPFGLTQLAVLAVFVLLGFRALRRGRAAVAGSRATPLSWGRGIPGFLNFRGTAGTRRE